MPTPARKRTQRAERLLCSGFAHRLGTGFAQAVEGRHCSACSGSGSPELGEHSLHAVFPPPVPQHRQQPCLHVPIARVDAGHVDAALKFHGGRSIWVAVVAEQAQRVDSVLVHRSRRPASGASGSSIWRQSQGKYRRPVARPVGFANARHRHSKCPLNKQVGRTPK